MIIGIVLLLTGLTVLFYPVASDQMNRYEQARVITDYKAAVDEMEDDKAAQMLADAEEYNKNLLSKPEGHGLSETEKKEYESLLDVDGRGVMGYVEIPKIKISLPIYHGTDEKVLQKAIGHMEDTSLPVGGEGTHSMISGHRGLPSAKLFTDIDQLEEGDKFIIRVLNRTMTYEVDRIDVVLPDEMGVKIEADEDRCTLATCTPYGVNTHRLLVSGLRAPDEEYETQPVRLNPILLIPLIAAPALLILLIILLFKTRKKGR